MKTVVIYNSQTGFTKRYAQWIAEETGADCFTLADAKKKRLNEYDTIVFGGWACAGGISKLGWFKSNMNQWSGKKLIVFCVGASPMESPDIEPALRKNFDAAQWENVNVFYCPGGFNYGKMSVASKLMMKMMISSLKAKKDKTKEDEIMIQMISSSYDISDRKYIKPILSCISK